MHELPAKLYFNQGFKSCNLFYYLKESNYAIAEILLHVVPPSYFDVDTILEDRDIVTIMRKDLDFLLEILLDRGIISLNTIQLTNFILDFDQRCGKKCLKLLYYRFRHFISTDTSKNVVLHAINRASITHSFGAFEVLLENQPFKWKAGSVDEEIKSNICELFYYYPSNARKLVRLAHNSGLLDIRHYFKHLGSNYRYYNKLNLQYMLATEHLHRSPCITFDDVRFIYGSFFKGDSSKMVLLRKIVERTLRKFPGMDFFSYILDLEYKEYNPYSVVVLASVSANLKGMALLDLDVLLKRLAQHVWGMKKKDKIGETEMKELRAFFVALQKEANFNLDEVSKGDTRTLQCIKTGLYTMTILYLYGGSDYTKKDSKGKTILDYCASALENSDPQKKSMLAAIVRYVLRGGMVHKSIFKKYVKMFDL